ncbi:hypothetical protein IEQ34_014361 [Dendrobium chrysotoxum]|uniref:Uncharacterized protein n=1 Tax=Dendrobium chrysotoxum TaxID=161865 RepID=A0AAV7GLS2_DENCH|nr:hypothetical protein IEQ34_014361 [Dendrobium chrysotoxum]
MIADLIAAGDHSGLSFFNMAAIPDTCGVAMEVPLAKLKVEAELPCFLGPTSVGHAARMLTPGATTSGFSIPPLLRLGPLEENEATAGVGRAPN